MHKHIEAQRKYISTHREIINKKRREWEKRKKIEDPNWQKKRQIRSNKFTKLWVLNNPEKMALSKRKHRLKKEYGMTIEQFDELYKQQNGVCAICGKTSPNTKKQHYSKTGLYIDHNHKTKTIRGLLCNRCNRATGMFEDDIELLKKVVNYLQKYDTSS